MADANSLITALIKPETPVKKGRNTFATAMQKMGFTSVFDIVRLPKSAFARQLARYSDANADVAYDNAMSYAALITRLYREYKTSSGASQQLAKRSGVRALQPGPTFQNMFNENWDEFCKVGAISANDGPAPYLSCLRVFSEQLEATGTDPKRILMDRRRPDLRDLLITHESTFTPRPMLEIVNEVLERQLRTYLDRFPADRARSIHQVLADRRYPFELPYNFYHHQCQLGLADAKPRLGELNYRASLLLPIGQRAVNDYGQVQQAVFQAQMVMSGLSPELQALLIEPPVFSNFYLTRNDLLAGWKSAGTAHLRPLEPRGTCYRLPADQADVATVNPLAFDPTSADGRKTLASLIFRKADQTLPVSVNLISDGPAPLTGWLINRWHAPSATTVVASLTVEPQLPVPPATGYTASFNLLTATGSVTAPVNLASQRYTLTLDEQYTLTEAERAFFKKSYGVEISEGSPLSEITRLSDFMQHTRLNAEQVEMLLARRQYAVRLSPNCPSKNPQHEGIKVPGSTESVLPFPHSNHYGACYVNGTGTGADSDTGDGEATPASIIRDLFDNAMGLEQFSVGDTLQWRLTKTSFDRLDRLQRMARLQRCLDIPFAKLDTLVMSAIRAEGEANPGMQFNQNTLRALGVYQYLQRHRCPDLDPEKFAALLHDLSPYASGKDAVPLFDEVFNRVQLFDTPLILDQTVIDLKQVDAVTLRTVLQLCAGLKVQPTEDSFLLIAAQTQKHLGALKRDLPTVSSLYRQSLVAQLFDHPVADVWTLAGLLGGESFKKALASGRLNAPTAEALPDILDVLMMLDWAFDWLKQSQQTVALLQQRLGPHAGLRADEQEDNRRARMAEQPLPDDLRERLNKFHADTQRSMVTTAQVAALGLPLYGDDNADPRTEISWFELLVDHDLLNDQGLLPGLDRELSLVDEPITWLQTGVAQALKNLNLKPPVKEQCAEKLTEFLLGAHDRQTQLLEGLFQETAKLAPDRCKAVIHWAHSTMYSILLHALDESLTDELIEHFQRVSRHAEIIVQLRLSNSALRLFVVNPQWLGSLQYEGSSSEPGLSDLYLLERFSHWFHSQSQSEDSILSYFSCANPSKAQLKNKALRQFASDTANAELARLLDWSDAEITALTSTFSDKRASSMADVDWVRRCHDACKASGLSATALLQATDLNDTSKLDAWKTVGEAVMAANAAADASLAR